MKSKRGLTMLVLLSLAALILGLVGCGPVATQLPPAIKIADFAFNEIIITGQRDNIKLVIEKYNANHQGQALGDFIQEIDLSYLGSVGPEEASPFPFPASSSKKKAVNRLFSGNQYTNLVMRLYKNPDDISTLIDHVIELTNSDLHVYADPNVFTDPVQQSSRSCGNPFSGGGSPFSGGGSPFADLGLGISSSAFSNQWAFQDTSIIPGGISALKNGFTGQDVTVGVFDTSPWPINGSQLVELPTGSFELTVIDSIDAYSRSPQTSALASVSNNVIDHGLFVTGLIKAIAPNSKVFLYRVLDNNGCGDLFTVSAAMIEFLRQMTIESNDAQHVNKVVLNLSMGVHVPDQIYHLIQDNKKLPEPLASLQTAVYESYRLGAVLVAASGNDSAPGTGNSAMSAQNMQLPAFYEAVLGVAATTKEGQRSCYSNQGNVAAPGGNGGVNPQNASNPCVPRTANATATPNPCTSSQMDLCQYGLVGPSTISSTKYGFWSGTSFSAPLVSGLAALAFERAGNNQGQIYCLIREGALPVMVNVPGEAPTQDQSLGQGIINVTRSLSDAGVLSSCGVP